MGPRTIVDPAKAILPVLLLDTVEGKIKDILGTGFFFSDRPTIMSCAHVLGTTPGPGEVVGVPRYEGPDAELGVIAHHDVVAGLSNVRKHPTQDLAIADVAVAQFEHFTIRSSDPPGNTPT